VCPNVLNDRPGPGAAQVIGERVHLIEGGPDRQAAQEFFRVQLVKVEGQLRDANPPRLPGGGAELER